MVIRRRKTRKGTTTDTGSIPVESTDNRPDYMTRLGWCVARRHCTDCPRVYRSKIEPEAVDYCKCDCHKEAENGDH